MLSTGLQFVRRMSFYIKVCVKIAFVVDAIGDESYGTARWKWISISQFRVRFLRYMRFSTPTSVTT